MISNTEKNAIRSLISSPQWPAIEALAKELKEKIKSNPKLKDTVDETALRTAFDEGQVTGIDYLFNELLRSQND